MTVGGNETGGGDFIDCTSSFSRGEGMSILFIIVGAVCTYFCVLSLEGGAMSLGLGS